MVEQLSIDTPGAGLHEITSRIAAVVAASEVEEGLCTLFVRHTSAYEHDTEGPDDMPAHIKAALTATSISITIQRKKLALGTWQGIYLWEHRQRGSRREVVVHVGS
jgi:thiamine phosphate synthase YjbQ (UPF0047 family)